MVCDAYVFVKYEEHGEEFVDMLDGVFSWTPAMATAQAASWLPATPSA